MIDGQTTSIYTIDKVSRNGDQDKKIYNRWIISFKWENSKIEEVLPLYHQERIWDNQIYENKKSLTDFDKNL